MRSPPAIEPVGESPAPVAIGGVGGSGTRVGAALLRAYGHYIGDDLNDSLDNLWFTLLFKRRSILVETDDAFARLASLFFTKMSGGAVSENASAELARLVDDRLQHGRAWLMARAQSFVGNDGAPGPRAWGWKEPNTHVVVDRLLAIDGALRYLHFVRHPLDMALSENQYQLENWGPLFLNRDVRLDARDALAYWCAAHRRALAIAQRWPERTLMVDFDALCDAPRRESDKIAAFLGVPSAPSAYAAVIRDIRRPPSSGRFRASDAAQFDAKDLRYVESLGYDVRMPARAGRPSHG